MIGTGPARVEPIMKQKLKHAAMAALAAWMFAFKSSFLIRNSPFLTTKFIIVNAEFIMFNANRYQGLELFACAEIIIFQWKNLHFLLTNH